VFAHYQEGPGHATKVFEFIPYRDPLFRQAMAWLTGKLGVPHIHVWCGNQRLEVDRKRLGRR
jgi:hypothetical protein